MRYLVLLLLLSGVCWGRDEFEDYVKVTAYRLVQEYDDGPCSIIRYLEENGISNDYVRAIETNNVAFAKKLIALKKEAKKKWPRHNVWCHDRCIGCPTVDKMFIIEVNKYRDTILLMDNHYIFSPTDKKMLYDKTGIISKILPISFKDFFEHDFDPYEKYQTIDSISRSNILYKGRELYNYRRKTFEKDFGNFHLITTTIDSLFSTPEPSQIFYYNNLKFEMDKHSRITLVDLSFPDYKGDLHGDESEFSVMEMKAGDSEEKLLAKFQGSAKNRYYKTKRMTLSELEDDYYYQVKISGDAGWISFHIKNHYIKEIEVEFNYPSD